ncbi:hypothetical protein BDB01DRAFT_799807 [Pilobolus umbonatus]|nr:hypothetical protein BDB01DRAFT_799807 [Pilobolus umbonatus]
MIFSFMSLSFWITFTAVTLYLTCSFLKFIIRNNLNENRRQLIHSLGDPYVYMDDLTFVGFFHPYCAAGGGGERVLWIAIRDIQKEFPNVICVVYTGDTDYTKNDIVHRVKNSFNIDLDSSRLIFIYLKKRYLVEDTRYPRFTLIMQSLGSLFIGFEALNQLVPDLLIDTMGYAFIYPLAYYVSRVKIAAYVHYPTISSDMLNRVYEQRFNHQLTTRGIIWSTGKLIYYKLFAVIYGFCGSFADLVMVNSSWTKGHIDSLWNTDSEIVYPPCDTGRLNELPLTNRQNIIVSVAQFRPEKDHALQLKSLAKLYEKYPKWKTEHKVQLILIGSCRNDDDAKRVDSLRKQCVDLDIQDCVEFEVNASYDLLVSTLSKSKVGIHTMWNEHFGIGVVEYMAAGLIPVAHNSGGPKLDIVKDYAGKRIGYLADTEDTFADALNAALSLPEEEYIAMASNARASASDKFSEEAFNMDLLCSVRSYLT